MYNKRTMKFAVIETGGKQYKISAGDTLSVEKLAGDYKEGDKVTFDRVLLVHDEKGTTVGTPYIKGAKIEAVFEKEGKGKKVMVIRFRPKSRHFVKKGHRQPFTKVKIKEIA